MKNNAAVLDTRKLMTGKDGKLFVEIEGQFIFLAEVDQFTVSMNATNADAQPVGSMLVFAVNTGVSFNLSMSEMVVRDDVIMEPLIRAISQGKMPTYNFQGSAERPDGQMQKITFRNCIPDGEFTLMNLTPGEIIKRTQTYRLNSIPEYVKRLAYK